MDMVPEIVGRKMELQRENHTLWPIRVELEADDRVYRLERELILDECTS
jgi:hypothetical protein